MQKRIVWCLSDGRPGHYSQSRGILKAFRSLYQVDVQWVEVRLRLPFMRPLLSWLLNHTKGPVHRLTMACYAVAMPLGRPDLIVSSGGNTLFLNVSLSRKFNCQNLFCGSLRQVSASNFTAYLTLSTPAHGNAIQVQLAPTEMDCTEMNVHRSNVRQAHGWHGTIWCLAVGGDSGTYHYTMEEWQALARFVRRTAVDRGIRWLLSTSRRSGGLVEQVLRDNVPAELLLDVVWYGKEPRQVMRDYLAASDVVLCTEDSLTMLTEAVSAGRPVVSLRPGLVLPDAAYELALQRLVDARLLTSVRMDRLGAVCFDELVVGLVPLAESVSARLARQLECVL